MNYLNYSNALWDSFEFHIALVSNILSNQAMLPEWVTDPNCLLNLVIQVLSSIMSMVIYLPPSSPPYRDPHHHPPYPPIYQPKHIVSQYLLNLVVQEPSSRMSVMSHLPNPIGQVHSLVLSIHHHRHPSLQPSRMLRQNKVRQGNLSNFRNGHYVSTEHVVLSFAFLPFMQVDQV